MPKCSGKDIEKITKNIKSVLKVLVNNNKIIKNLINDFNKENLKSAKKEFNKNSISQLSETLESEILKALASEELRKEEINKLVSYLKSTDEIIKIATNTREVLNKLESKNKGLEDKEIKKLASKMYTNIIKSLEASCSMIDFENIDDILEVYNEVVLLESKIDNIYEQINKYIFVTKQDIEEKDILKVLRKSEKIANRALGIASLIRYPYKYEK